MGKDPAFLFYPGDWLGGTIGMTFEEKGAYMELLMMQFTRGHMTSHMIGQTVGQLWVKVQDKFVQDDQGLWYNERLDREKFKRKTYVESRKNNKEGKNQHKSEGGHMTSHMTSHMENRNDNGINNKEESDFFKSNAHAYMMMSGNYHDIDSGLKIIANNGWPGVTESDVKAIMHHFIETQVDLKKDASDIRSHFRRWVNKQPVEKLRGWVKTIIENHARRRQGSG